MNSEAPAIAPFGRKLTGVCYVSKGILRRRRGIRHLPRAVHRLPLFQSKDKLKTLMIGSVLLERVGEVTLTL
jgi:hypothetical protein